METKKFDEKNIIERIVSSICQHICAHIKVENSCEELYEADSLDFCLVVANHMNCVNICKQLLRSGESEHS